MAKQPQQDRLEAVENRGVKSRFSTRERDDYAREIEEKRRTILDVAQECGLTRQGVSLWLKHYRERILGVERKVGRPGRKKKRTPTRDELHRFQWELRTRRPSQLGVDGGGDDTWSEESVRAFLKQELGEIFTSKHIWRWMEDYLIEPEPDSWIVEERRDREARGEQGPPPRQGPAGLENGDADDGDSGEDFGTQVHKRGRPRKNEEQRHEVRKLTDADVERMEKENAEVRQKMIADYRNSAGLDREAKPGQRLEKLRKSKSRHTKPRRKKRGKK